MTQMPIAAPILSPGQTTIRAVSPGGQRSSNDHVTLSKSESGYQYNVGIPWMMVLETGQYLYGAFWHNRFGAARTGSSIELSTFAARWLYNEVLNRNPIAVLMR
jgi:hypothetical protein